jgi:RNAse (barnase) inhibitor barstar
MATANEAEEAHMTTIKLNGALLTDWEAFHTVSQEAFGFPAFYGRNISAWIDCLSYLRDDDGMSAIRLQADELLTIALSDSEALRQHFPELLEELQFCVEMINERYADYGEKPALQLLLL